MATGLLAFQSKIVQEMMDPATSELLLIARGLGLRTILCTLLNIYNTPQSLVLLINASSDEEDGIGSLMCAMGCPHPGLRRVTHELGRSARRDLYRHGGVISVTSRILVSDLLVDDVPCELITGLLVLHAERITPLATEAFIVRLYRKKNKSGFLKAFSDQPEQITHGMNPLRAIMKELGLRTSLIYPRFHEEVQQTLERRKADVVELHQPMTQNMIEIHESILLCMTATLSELKRSNSTLDLDDLVVENAQTRMFDIIVRKQLDPVWHKVGPKTKQLVGDLTTLRNLMSYLLSYDCIDLHSYLESIIHANTVSKVTGERRQHQSPWLLLDAADVLIKAAKRRCYLTTHDFKITSVTTASFDQEDEDWRAFDDLNGLNTNPTKKWLPKGMEPVLEELPKWDLLLQVLQEIEETMLEQPLSPQSNATDTVIVMVSSQKTCDQLRDFLDRRDPSKPVGEQGHRLMERRLREYLRWKARLNEGDKVNSRATGQSRKQNQPSSEAAEDTGLSEAMKRKDAARQHRAANRRRVRGGVPTQASQPDRSQAARHGLEADAEGGLRGAGDMLDESDSLATFLATQASLGLDDMALADDDTVLALQIAAEESAAAARNDDEWFGLVPPEQTVMIRVYSDDADDMMLADIKPRFIVAFEPSQEFVRRIEVYRGLSPGLAVRLYFLMYENSSEEVKFLTSVRKEKDAFERLIKERGSMLLPLGEDIQLNRNDLMYKQLSTRLAGGAKTIEKEPPRVIVDIREMNSSLPNLLDRVGILVIPVTLTVGDYILSPDICVERKSIPDLTQSLKNGRLYTQCELMSSHYDKPMLLIEFEEHKAFSLEIVSEVKSYPKAGKFIRKAPKANDDSVSITAIQSKLVLLTLAFPRIRIIWSSSPYQTADIFKDLKANFLEPDPTQALRMGAADAEDDVSQNQLPEDLLRGIPGITAKNVKHVMSKVRSVRELCELELPRVQEILNNEPGKLCWEFLHRGDKA